MKVFLALALMMSFSLAEARGLSAVRAAGESAATARLRVLKKPPSLNLQVMETGTPEAFAQPLSEIGIEEIPEVSSLAELEREFNYLRDTRFLESERTEFPRRITWLFPDDGCYARAEMAAIEIDHHQFLAPRKIFAFGDLSVNTKNSLSGYVTWWYHVAVAYRFQQQIYVFDPAISPKRPLLLKDWNQQMGGASTEIKYAVCAARTYDPDADCKHPAYASDRDVEEEQKGFFRAEWNRVLKLNRDPEKELGELPPWL